MPQLKSSVGTLLVAASALMAISVLRAQTYTVLHSFPLQSAPAVPYAGLVEGSDGNFYGTTSSGGSSGGGTIFKEDGAGRVTTLHSFSGEEGSPYAGLIQGADEYLYGTTFTGGGLAGNNGTVFKMDLSGNLTTLHVFTSSPNEGSGPSAKLVRASDGRFYGTTSGGGAMGYGTAFKMEAAGNLTTIHSFIGTDGATPRAELIQANDGNLYGTTAQGGVGGCEGLVSGCGTVFKMDLSGHLTTSMRSRLPMGPGHMPVCFKRATGTFTV